jgi:hypothetical protein
MRITRRSPVSGRDHTLTIPVTQEQLDAWRGGVHIQDAMPNIPPALREFIKTGITPEEWDEVFANPFADEDDEDDDA